MTAAGSEDRPHFEISVEDGRGLLLLRPRTFFGWLHVPQLDLSIPNVTFPLDITGGLNSFQRQRLTLLRAGFLVEEEKLARLIEARAAPLRSAGFDDVRVRLREGAAEVTCRARLGTQEAELFARAVIEAGDEDTRVVITDAQLLGWLRRPAWLVAHDLLCLLTKAAGDAGGAPAATWPVVQRLGVVVMRPLELFLQRVLSPAGWRLPDTSRMRVLMGELAERRVELSYAARTLPAEHLTPRAPLLEGAERGDELLVKNDLAGAAAAYRVEVKRHPGQARALVDRLLMVLCARDGTLGDAEKVAREALKRWPEHLPSLRTLATVALSRGGVAEAAEHLERMATLAEAAGDRELAARCALQAARLVGTADAARAAALYRRVTAHQPGDDEAILALAELHAAAGEWEDVVRVWRGVTEGQGPPAHRAEALVRIGEVLLDPLGAPARATVELEAALALDERNRQAWELLARAREVLGEPKAAAQALEKVLALASGRDEAGLRGRTLAKIAELSEAAGDLEGARESWRKILEAHPDDELAIERLAGIAARAGDAAGATSGYRRLIELCPPGQPRRVLAEQALMRLYVGLGEAEAARGVLEAATGEPDPEAVVGLAVLERQAGRTEEACALLDGVAPRLQAGSPAYARAARELAQLARSPEEEVRWLDAALADGAPPVAGGDTAEWRRLALRRAALHLDAGDARAARPLVEAVLSALEEHAEPDPELRRLYARVLEGVGDFIGCAVELELLAETASDAGEQAALLARAAQTRLAGGEVEGAFVLAKRAEALDATLPEVRLALAEVAWRSHDWEGAVALYAPLLDESYGQARVDRAQRLGGALEQLGRLREALTAYRAAVDEPDGAGEAIVTSWVRSGELHEQLGEYRQAANAFVAAASDERSGEDGAQRAAHLRRAAAILHRRLGDHAGAVEALEQALKALPGDAQAFDALEAVWSELGDVARLAATQARRAGVSGEEAPDAAALDDAGGAPADDAGGAPAEAPPVEAPPATVKMAALVQAVSASRGPGRRPSPAIEAVRAQLNALPVHKVELRRATRLQLAELHRQAGDAEAACEELRAVVADQPGNLPALTALAEIHLERGEWSDAAHWLARLAQVHTEPSQRAEILYRLGELQRGLGDEEAASDAWLKAIDLDPRHVPTARRLTDHFARTGDFASALEMAITLDEEGALDETDRATLARTALAAALLGDARRALDTTRRLGVDAGALALAAAEAASLETPPPKLLEALRALARPPGPSLDALKRALAGQGGGNPRVAALAAKL